MPAKKAPPVDSKANVVEQEPTPEPEPASPDEVDELEQRGEDTPDPLEGLTFQQLQEHPHFKEDWDKLTSAQKEAQEKAWREGQSAGAKQADEKTRQWAAEQEAKKAFEELERQRTSDDPDEQQKFAQAMGDPRKKEAYDHGQRLQRGPSREQVENELIGTIMGGVDASLNERLSKHGELSDAEKARVDKGKFKNLGELVSAKVDLLVERGIAAGVKEVSEKERQEITEAAETALLDKLGIEYSPDEIKGRTPTSQESKLDSVLASPHTTQEEKADAFEKKHGYRPKYG